MFLEVKTPLKKMSEVLSEVLTQKEYNKVSAIVSFIKEHGEITPYWIFKQGLNKIYPTFKQGRFEVVACSENFTQVLESRGE
ncbi:MAG: hypothetical protein NC517_03265 [Firmicutes bacterium]|nr:hypothetical protein [Bacillota bacterium]